MDPDSRVATARWLADPASADARAAAVQAHQDRPGDPLAAASLLRRIAPGITAAQASAVLEQADLARLAAERYGIRAGSGAGGLLLTRDGLEQATRPEVAAERAALVAGAGARRVVDLTAGLGFDAGAFLAAGLAVTAVERDPAVAVLLAHNHPGLHVIVGDARDEAPALLAGLDPHDVVFVDPARRDPDGPRGAGMRARPERDPERWSPAWSAIAALPHPRIAAKVAPSFRPPEGWHADWSSVQRSVVECAVYSWPVQPSGSRALVWQDGTVHVLAGSAEPAATTDALGPMLHEPDPAVLRAGAVATLTARHAGLACLDGASTWLTGPAVDSPFLRSYPVLRELVGGITEQRRALDAAGVGGLTVKCRDVDVSPATVLRELGRREGPGHVLVVTRVGARSLRVLCAPATLR